MSKKEQLGEINYEEFDNYLNNTIHIVHEILKEKKSFKACFKKLYNYMKQGFEKPEVRKHPLKYKFTDEPNEPIREMEVRHFITNLIMWYPFMKLEKYNDVNETHIFDCTCPTKKYMCDYINNKIIIPYRTSIDTETINKGLDNLIFMARKINKDFGVILATTLDMESFMDMREKYPRFKELTETKIPKDMQPKEIEILLEEKKNEFVKIINEDENNNIKPFLVTGMGINKGQLSQFAISGGLKPDIEGNVIPVPINSNYINGGLNSIENFYIDGQAGSKPLILNKTVMGKSGHFAYKTMTLASNYRLSKTITYCDSKRPINFIVEDKAHLMRINGRYYIDDKGELKNINSNTDTFLIGKTIKLRDPVTCCAPDGICHICYGDLFYTNNNPYFHIGKFSATQYNNPLEQKILSSKHMLATNSNLISFDDVFNRFFTLDSNKIKLNFDSNEDFNLWYIAIDEDDYFVQDDLNDNIDFNVYSEKFYLINKKTREKIEIKENNKHDMFFFGSILDKFSKVLTSYKGTLLSNIEEVEPIAIINIMNNELTTPLKNIMMLLDRANHYGCTTIDEMVNKLVTLTIESDISADAVHGSILIKGLIRDKNNILYPPNFKDPDKCDDYQILSVTNALLYNPSLTVSFAFESLHKQLINPLTYRKYKPSDYDLFFVDDLYNASKKFYDLKKKRKHYKKFHKK